MPSTEQGKQQVKPVKRTHEQRSGVIIGQLLQALGRPATLYRVEVRHLWDNHYRANVFVGDTVTSTRIAHSFFLMADEDGKIVASVPDIAKKY
ncbi:MAG: hypothetical protein ACRELG_27335 [Gemmataceae bacterium]